MADSNTINPSQPPQSCGWSQVAKIFVGAVATLASADFKPAYGLTPPEWKALFSVGSLASAAWLVFSIVRAVLSTKISIDSIIERLKQQSGQQ